MRYDEIENGSIYEVKMTRGNDPLVIRDILPHGLLCENLNTGREVFIKKESTSRRVIARIDNMQQWRLMNGERRF